MNPGDKVYWADRRSAYPVECTLREVIGDIAVVFYGCGPHKGRIEQYAPIAEVHAVFEDAVLDAYQECAKRFDMLRTMAAIAMEKKAKAA